MAGSHMLLIKPVANTVIAALFILLVAQTARAESSKTFGDYEVHYSVFTSTFITPDVARSYNIVRGKDRALINIAIRKRGDDGRTRAHAATIDGSSSDLIHKTPLEFREIREQDSIYYIAELRFYDKELRTFTLEIQPQSSAESFSLKFSKQLYFDE